MSELPERDRFLEMLSIPGQYAQDGINWLIEGVDYVTDQTNTWEAMGYSPEEIEQNKEALKYELATGALGFGVGFKGLKMLSPHVKKLMHAIKNTLKSKTGSNVTQTIKSLPPTPKSLPPFEAPPRGIPRGHSGYGTEAIMNPNRDLSRYSKADVSAFTPENIKVLRNLNSKADVSAFTPENIKVLRNLNRRNKESIDRLKNTRGKGWDSMSPVDRAWSRREGAKFKELMSELGIPEGKATRTGGSSILKKLLPFLLLSEHK